MKIEDIDKEFKELARSLKEAEVAFSQGRFAEAEPLYKKALDLVERSYGEDHGDTSICLQNLADCYYALRRYQEGVPVLRRLLLVKERREGVSHPDVATVLFKLAKTYEKLGKPREAESFYKRALQVSERAFGPDHLFVATVLEGYSSMLRRNQMRLPQAEEMEERLRTIRDVSANPRSQSSFLHNLSSSMPPTGEPSDSQNLENSTRLRSLRSHADRAEALPEEEAILAPPKPKFLGLAIVLVLVIGIVCGALLFVSATHRPAALWNILKGNSQAEERKANEAVPKETSFSAPDGLKRLILVNDHEAVLTRSGVNLKGTYQSDIHNLTITPLNQSLAYRFRRTEAGLVDEDETVLYPADAPEVLIIQKMRELAKAAQRYYRQYNKYPKTTDDILSGAQTIAYKNPFIGTETIPMKRSLSPYDTDIDTMTSEDYAQVQAAIDRLPLWTPDTRLGPGKIEWYHTLCSTEGDSVFIRGTDREGKFIRASHPGLVYLIQLSQGQIKLNR